MLVRFLIIRCDIFTSLLAAIEQLLPKRQKNVFEAGKSVVVKETLK